MNPLFLGLFHAALSLGISPPWQSLVRALTHSVGQSPCVTVGNFDDARAVVPVHACSEAAADALALVLKREYKMGQMVKVEVLDPSGNDAIALTAPAAGAVDTVESALRAALDGNTLVTAIYRQAGFYPIAVELKREVVQYWDDNMSDRYGNANYVAADLFGQVLDLKPFNKVQVSVSTAKQ